MKGSRRPGYVSRGCAEEARAGGWAMAAPVGAACREQAPQGQAGEAGHAAACCGSRTGMRAGQPLPRTWLVVCGVRLIYHTADAGCGRSLARLDVFALGFEHILALACSTPGRSPHDTRQGARWGGAGRPAGGGAWAGGAAGRRAPRRAGGGLLGAGVATNASGGRRAGVVAPARGQGHGLAEGVAGGMACRLATHQRPRQCHRSHFPTRPRAPPPPPCS